MALGTMSALEKRYPGIGYKVMFFDNKPPEELPVRFHGEDHLVEELSINLRLELDILLHLLTFRLYKPVNPLRRCSFDNFLEADAILDFSGGDSFSDIYGVYRFLKLSLIKMETIWLKKKLVLMPQTLGPFKRGWVRRIAGHIVRRASCLFFRDEDSYRMAVDTLGADVKKTHFLQDMGFRLEPSTEPEVLAYCRTLKGDASGPLIGFNISGLLYNGGYTGKNMFDLLTDYPELVEQITERFLTMDENLRIVFVPHVICGQSQIEDDCTVCKMMARKFEERYPGRVMFVDEFCRADQLKAIISNCDFFMGSRMHACIAAVSQKVPTVPIAYSKKFAGVWSALGLAEFISDPRKQTTQQVIETILSAYQSRHTIIPKFRDNIEVFYSVLDGFLMDGGKDAYPFPEP